MDREELVLAGLGVAQGEYHTPVQVQKLFFLIEQNIATQLGGPHFSFRPHNYGPFDQAVYETLDGLARADLVEIDTTLPWRRYRLTCRGQERADRILQTLPASVVTFLRRASEFVLGLGFTDLVRAIYKTYPEMRANSVFQE